MNKRFPQLTVLNLPLAPYTNVRDGVVTLSYIDPSVGDRRDIYTHYTAEQLYRRQGLPIYFTPSDYNHPYAARNMDDYENSANDRVPMLETQDALPLRLMKSTRER